MDGLVQNRLLGEALFVGFEHEAMHLETFLYMLLHSEKTLPPVESEPDFESIFNYARRNEKPNRWFTVPEQSLLVGLDDPDDSAVPTASFGWDNEKPQRKVVVHAFEAQGRPITNGEFAKYLQANNIRNWPASWVSPHLNNKQQFFNGTNCSNFQASKNFLSNYAVRTMFGPVSLELAQDWPVIASYDELAGYAKWKGCRLPTYEEARGIYNYSAWLKTTKEGKMTNGYRLVSRVIHDNL